MKSTSVSTKIITILLLLAVIGYFAVQGYNYFVSPETTTLVYRYHSERSIALRGYVVRDEQVVDCNETLIELKHAEGSAWYFAANVNEENAASLKENSRLTLRMASGVGFDLPVTLTRISAVENGKCLIVLKSTRYLSYMTLLREQNAELIISAYDGLRVPKNALRVDENGVSGVYCLVGRVAYFKPVSIVYQGSDYCLVEPGTIEAATESQKSLYTLRPNDEVIVSAGELYNGKVVD